MRPAQNQWDCLIAEDASTASDVSVYAISHIRFSTSKQVTKDEYAQFLADHPMDDPRSIAFILKEREKLQREVPTPYMFGSHNVDVSGNHIYHAKNVHQSFDIKSGEDAKFGYTVREIRQQL